MRETVWSYGNVTMSKTSLEQIDTYCIQDMPLHSRPKFRSALDIIVRHEVEAFAKDELFNKLITDKWNNFGRRMYLTWSFLPYVLVLTLFTCMLTLLCQQKHTAWVQRLEGGDVNVMLKMQGFGWEHMWGADLPAEDLATSVLRTIFMVLVVPWLVLLGWKHRRLGPKDYDPNEDGEISAGEMMLFFYKNLKFLLDYFSAIFIFLAYVFAYGRADWMQKLELQVRFPPVLDAAFLVRLPCRLILQISCMHGRICVLPFLSIECVTARISHLMLCACSFGL